jgi:dienelactone hydrolase
VAVALAMPMALAGCTSLLAGGEAPLERTWVAARITPPDAPAGPSGTPVVVYVHGCGGLDDDWRDWTALLARHGYAVIAPDHRARGGRPPGCDTPTLYGRGDLDRLVARDAEVRYALRQVRTLSWVRQSAVFLLGFDEGAVVAAAYTGPPFTGYVLTGWTCTSPHSRGRLATARDRPVLALRWAHDPRFVDPAWNGDCGASLDGRPGSRSLVLDGAGHSTAGDERARRAVVDFLQAHTPR